VKSKSNLVRCMALIILVLVVQKLWALDPSIPEDALLYASFDLARDTNPKSFEADFAGGKRSGKPLTDNTEKVIEVDLHKTWNNIVYRCFPTGATNQAIAFEGAANIDPKRGAIGFWVKSAAGKSWTPGKTRKDVYVTLEGGGAVLSIISDKPETLTVDSTVSGSEKMEVPFKVSKDDWHFVLVSYDDGKAEIFLDGRASGTTDRVLLPSSVERIIIGQFGPGAATNKLLDEFMIFSRPMKLSDANRLYLTRGGVALRKMTSIVKTGRKISVDGIIDPDEWRDAAVITGMLKVKSANVFCVYGPAQVADDQGFFYLTYDDDYLYVAYYAPPPARIKDRSEIVAVMLQKTRFQHDADDCIIIFVQDQYPNGDSYKFAVNGADVTYDFTVGGINPGSKLSGINLAWEPGWRPRSVLNPEGWHVEAALPFADLEIPRPEPGDTWRMNFIRRWKQVKVQDDAWAFGIRTEDTKKHVAIPAGHIKFQGDEGVVVRVFGMHESGMPNMAFCSFGTFFWDGENFNSIINDKQRNYRGVLEAGCRQHALR